MITYALFTLCSLLIISQTLSVFMIVKLSKFIFVLEDEVEESIDALDKSYSHINDVMQVPVASDDLMTRGIVNEIKNAREIVLKVQQKLVSFTLINTKNVVEEEE